MTVIAVASVTLRHMHDVIHGSKLRAVSSQSLTLLEIVGNVADDGSKNLYIAAIVAVTDLNLKSYINCILHI